MHLLAEGSSRVAHLDGLLDPRLRTLALGHAEALRDHHHLAETVGSVAVISVLGEAVSAAQGGGEAEQVHLLGGRQQRLVLCGLGDHGQRGAGRRGRETHARRDRCERAGGRHRAHEDGGSREVQ